VIVAALVRRSAVQSLYVLVPCLLLLALFQLIIVAQAASIESTRSFERMAELIPAFLQRGMGGRAMLLATFKGTVTAMLSRPAYEIAGDHELPQRLAAALSRAGGTPRITGASFWTDAAVLGHSGIPSVLFGPGGAGLHSIEEYVKVADVQMCRDALVVLAQDFC